MISDDLEGREERASSNSEVHVHESEGEVTRHDGLLNLGKQRRRQGKQGKQGEQGKQGSGSSQPQAGPIRTRFDISLNSFQSLHRLLQIEIRLELN